MEIRGCHHFGAVGNTGNAAPFFRFVYDATRTGLGLAAECPDSDRAAPSLPHRRAHRRRRTVKKARDAWRKHSERNALVRALRHGCPSESDRLIEDLEKLVVRLGATIGSAAAAGALLHYAELFSKMAPTRGPEKGTHRNKGILSPTALRALYDAVRPGCRSDNHAFEEVAGFIVEKGNQGEANYSVQSHSAVVQAIRRSVKSRAKANEARRTMPAALPVETLDTRSRARIGGAKARGLFGLSARELEQFLGGGV